ncbi:unnamed protein product, partial [Cladocopium goreaui]
MKGKMEPEQRQALIEEGKKIKEEINSLEAKVDELSLRMNALALAVPNLTHPDTPIGEEENATVVRINGEPRTSESAGFQLRDHLELGEMLDLFDFESGGKVSGQKFLYFKNGAALLELALVQWASHEAVKRGFQPFIPPDLVRAPVVAGCGFAPRDDEATQRLGRCDSDLCLAGTAEIPMAGMFMNETLIASKELPKRLVAFSHAFRTEAGSSGSENRGIYRLHQFSKVELFAVTRSDLEESNEMLEEIKSLEEDLFTQLGLCFRVLDMPTEELGAPAYRKFDMEAWMPGLEKWGEISSCSSCSDFQARRLNIRHKEEYNQKGNLQFAHTLNGTACAVPRMIISILETFQNEDGSVTIPEVLRPYMMGLEVPRDGPQGTPFQPWMANFRSQELQSVSGIRARSKKAELADQRHPECQLQLPSRPLVMEPSSGFYWDPVLVLDFKGGQALGPAARWVPGRPSDAGNTGTHQIAWAKVRSEPWQLGAEAQALAARDPSLEDEAVDPAVRLAASGALFVGPQVRKGLLPLMLAEVLQLRAETKRLAKTSSAALAKRLEHKQFALKYFANVTYGYSSASFSGRMPCSEIADAIVATGRRALEEAANFIEAHWEGAKVVYGDTDSVFVQLKGYSLEEAFQTGKEICAQVSAKHPAPVELEFEKVYMPCLCLTKKRYGGLAYAKPPSEGGAGNFEAKGLEAIRRDQCRMASNVQNEILNDFFRTKDLSSVKRIFIAHATAILKGGLDSRHSVADFSFFREARLGTYRAEAEDGGGATLPPQAAVARNRIAVEGES